MPKDKPKEHVALLDNRFNALKGMEKNWDGYGADPISERTINHMRLLLDIAIGDFKLIHIPSVVPAAGDSIQIEWHLADGSECEFRLCSDGTVETWAWPKGSGIDFDASGPKAFEYLKLFIEQSCIEDTRIKGQVFVNPYSGHGFFCTDVLLKEKPELNKASYPFHRVPVQFDDFLR